MTLIAETAFPIMLEPLGEENQSSQFAENKITHPTHFILLAKRLSFFLSLFYVFFKLIK